MNNRQSNFPVNYFEFVYSLWNFDTEIGFDVQGRGEVYPGEKNKSGVKKKEWVGDSGQAKICKAQQLKKCTSTICDTCTGQNDIMQFGRACSLGKRVVGFTQNEM